MSDQFNNLDPHVQRANKILDDLVEYTGKPRQLVIARSKAAMAELAWQWHDKKDTLDYYKKTDLYIFDLTKYQSQLVLDVNMMVEEIRERKIHKILDFGGGIGEYTIRTLQECKKTEVTFLELKDSQTLKYAEWRFTKHKVSPKIVTEDYPWQAEEWDAVFAMDVIEHLEKADAQKALKALQQKAKYVFANPEFLKFHELFPQHITEFEMIGFQRVGTMLWKNKNYG